MKTIKLKNSVIVYVTDEETSITFEDSTIDYDMLEATLDINKGVALKNQLSRAFTAKTPMQLSNIMNVVQGNVDGTAGVFKKSFARELKKFIESVSLARVRLQNIKL